MPIDPASQLGRTMADRPMGVLDAPLSPLSAPVALGMQAVGRAGGRPLRDLVLRANALLEKYAPTWAEKVLDVPVSAEPDLAFRGLHRAWPREIVIGGKAWHDPIKMADALGPLRPLSTLIHESAHARLAGPHAPITNTPRPLSGFFSSAYSRSFPTRQRPWGISPDIYRVNQIPDEVLADAMKTRLFRKAFPDMGPFEATLAHAWEPSRMKGWLRESDAPALKDLLDYLVR